MKLLYCVEMKEKAMVRSFSVCLYLYGMGRCSGQNNDPQDAHALILRTCDCVTLHGRCAKIKDRRRDHPRLFWWSQCYHTSP